MSDLFSTPEEPEETQREALDKLLWQIADGTLLGYLLEREKTLDAIITLFEPEPPAYAEMTVEEFQNALDQLAITPDDGCADAIAGVRVIEENIDILAPLPAGTTHIRWYNK